MYEKIFQGFALTLKRFTPFAGHNRWISHVCHKSLRASPFTQEGIGSYKKIHCYNPWATLTYPFACTIGDVVGRWSFRSGASLNAVTRGMFCAQRAYNTRMSGFKARGRPRKTWIIGVKDSLKAQNAPLVTAFGLAAKRNLHLLAASPIVQANG